MHLSVSYFSIAIRIYANAGFSIPEMAGGWRNELMRNEVEFMILDGAYVSL